ncbi:MAG TPA: hypothetical protein VMU57_04365 [Edaphobacter sp.]|uniref:hypothetical protein n=1 Tax=Edaphobacter sp. TaxID=1934404 RepID=UPI002B7B13A0|nr:hypothetical protein [Edaphobacter sp.]HUZ94125.1 hypothetical protein [Edaphobacter sp.]
MLVTINASRPGPALPFSIAASGLAAVFICGLFPLISQAGQAYFLRTLSDALEVAGKVLHLPALIGADLLARNTAAGTDSLFRNQLVHAFGNGKVFEVGHLAPPLAPLHPPEFRFRLAMRWNIVRVDRLAIQLACEAQQQLGQIIAVFQPIRARSVIVLLRTIQLQGFLHEEYA